MKKQKIIKNNLDEIFKFNNNDHDLEFEEMVINSDVIQVISELMKKHKKINSKTALAKELKVSSAYISKLFSGDKYFNVPLLARVQRIFNIRLKVVTSDMIRQYKNEGVGKVYHFLTFAVAASNNKKIMDIDSNYFLPFNTSEGRVVESEIGSTTIKKEESLTSCNY